MANRQELITDAEKFRKENTRLREEIARKNSELEKKTRDLEIEAALEKVRTRTMGMKSSEELPEVANIMFLEVQALGVPAWSCGYCILREDKKSSTCIMSSEGTLQKPFLLPHRGEKSFEEWDEFIYGEGVFFIQELGDQAIKNHYDFMKSLPQLKPVFKDLQDAGPSLPEYQINHLCKFDHGFLLFITYSEVTYAHEIFRRFARVFNQTYTRFLDLQKAENQAREAQIEAAVERVRAKSMAMRHTDDLHKVTEELLHQLNKLSVDGLTGTTIYLVEEDDIVKAWDLSSPGSVGTPDSYTVTYDAKKYPVLGGWVNEWRTSDQNFFALEFPKEALLKAVEEWKEVHPEIATIFKNAVDSGKLAHQWSPSGRLSKGILAIDLIKPPTEDTKDIVTKMAGAFNLAYQRFEDLQKAEARAREAKIETALEKVRSRTMGMQKSDELADVANVLFEEMNELVHNLWTCGFVLCEKDREEDEWWLGLDDGFTRGFFLPNVNDYAHSHLYEGWLKEEAFRTVQLEGDDLQEHYDWLMQIQVAKNIFDEMEAAGMQRPDWQKLHAAYFSKGYLVIITREPCYEEAIFKRFAQVFDLTYTRFLDLQKAESQAREAQIENALEKVRSRSLAMQSPDELIEVAELLREEMGALGVEELETSSIYIQNDENGKTQCWFTIKDAENPQKSISDRMTIDLKDTRVGQEMLDFYHSDSNQTSIKMTGDSRIEWIRYCAEKSNLFTPGGFYGDSIPDRTYHLYKFSNGYIGAASPGEISEESWDLLKRATSVFSFAFTRFLDLKKAREQTREAQIELSLERIRARVTAMQESSDLLEIVVSMRSEFVNLGHEAHYFWHMRWNPETYSKAMTSGDGSQIGMVMTLPRHIHGDITAVAEWEKGSEPVHVLAMETDTAVDYVDKMIRLGDFERVDPKAPTLDDIRHIGGLTFVMARTTHGEIGYSLPGVVPNPPKDAVDTLVRFASIFDLAYRRFEDLKKAEAQVRENRIELALERIRGQVTSMEESSDLFDIVVSMRKEFLELGHQADYFWHMRWLPEVYEMSMTSEDGSRVGMVISIPKFVHNNIPNLCEWEKGNKPSFVLALDPKGAWDYMENMNTHGHYEKADPNAPTREDIDHIGGLTFIIARTTHGEIGYSLPGVVPDPPADAVETLIRFAKVFDLAYKRFEDLKAAEKDLIEIKAARKKAEEALNELKETQSQLVQQEKLASLGQLTAGIAHEIKNPLNFVNNFSEVSLELIREAIDEIKEIKEDEHIVEATEILGDVEFNLMKIHEHGTRANGIVSSMLLHSRGGSGKMEPSDLNALIKEYVNLSFHGMRAGKEPINVDIQLDLDPNLGDVKLISEDFSRVILNICNNAFDAMRQKTKTDSAYLPVLSVATGQESGRLKISIADNGPGVPDDLMDKILEPFFTTKKGKEGTGLGLSITHDIVKAHGGELVIHSEKDRGTTITIDLVTI